MIDVKNLEYTYKNAQSPAVKDISFQISEGEIFGFLGPSGAGKSTVQKILIRLLDGYRGEIFLNGENLKRLNSSMYENIGVGFELPNHYLKLTAKENLSFFASLYSKKTQKIEPLLESVGLLEDQDKKVETFSKGMKMRLNFARAVLSDPEIIFLDEPTTGLDPANAKNIKDLIIKLKKRGRTIFITTHDMSVADSLCDRVAFITEGRLIEIDSPKQLKLKYGQRYVMVEYFKDETLLTEKFDLDTLGSNEKFLSIIRQYKIQTIHSMETTLEDVFIRVTGQKLYGELNFV